ncbi:MAG: tsaD [Alphaproteobacteria bacterium]|jgi:N6-L-threonylcarbamoyladenine synthase|nr:tsaD [Alphaproteobacteria bacterium]
MALILGLETSCDETAVALVDSGRRILAERILSQIKEHKAFGGVVPEIAARAHLDHLDRLIGETMEEAGLSYGDLSAVAATAGPGLIGGVIVGVTTAKAIALAHDLPFIGVNHLEGHALTARLTDDVAFPYLLLLVSGGHCQLLAVEGVGKYRRLGTTIDDAVGEAFDKTAKLLGLGFPGGPAVEQAALAGNASRFALPRPMLGRKGCDFSLAGLKTAVRLAAEKLGEASAQDIGDLCASFQAAIGDVLVDRCRNALEVFSQTHSGPVRLVVAGGVAANKYLRQRLHDLAQNEGASLIAPPPRLCTDNAAMIAWAGIERLRLGQCDALDLAPRPRWPLDPAATAKIGRAGLGAGVKV